MDKITRKQANQLEFQGNSVAYIYDKMKAYSGSVSNQYKEIQELRKALKLNCKRFKALRDVDGVKHIDSWIADCEQILNGKEVK